MRKAYGGGSQWRFQRSSAIQMKVVLRVSLAPQHSVVTLPYELGLLALQSKKIIHYLPMTLADCRLGDCGNACVNSSARATPLSY
jgi:hypothetical protein